MARFTFYKQMRNDGGVRYGIDINEASAWMRFNPGSGIDPGLLWYVNVDLKGESLNGSPEAAREIFLQYADAIQSTLGEVSEAVRLESDPLVWPNSSDEVEVAPGVTLKVVCSAIRRVPARILAQQLAELQRDWENHIRKLEPVAPVAAG